MSHQDGRRRYITELGVGIRADHVTADGPPVVTFMSDCPDQSFAEQSGREYVQPELFPQD